MKNRFHLDPVDSTSKGVTLLTRVEVYLIAAAVVVRSMHLIVKDKCTGSVIQWSEIKKPCMFLGKTTDPTQTYYSYIALFFVFIVFLIEVAILLIIFVKSLIERCVFQKLYEKFSDLRSRSETIRDSKVVHISNDFPAIHNAMIQALKVNDIDSSNLRETFITPDGLIPIKDTPDTRRLRNQARYFYRISHIIEHMIVLGMLAAIWMLIATVLHVPNDHFLSAFDFLINFDYDDAHRKAIFASEVECRVKYYNYAAATELDVQGHQSLLVDSRRDNVNIASFLEILVSPDTSGSNDFELLEFNGNSSNNNNNDNNYYYNGYDENNNYENSDNDNNDHKKTGDKVNYHDNEYSDHNDNDINDEDDDDASDSAHDDGEDYLDKVTMWLNAKRNRPSMDASYSPAVRSKWVEINYYMRCIRNRADIYYIVFGIFQVLLIATVFKTIYSCSTWAYLDDNLRDFDINLV